MNLKKSMGLVGLVVSLVLAAPTPDGMPKTDDGRRKEFCGRFLPG